MNVLTEHISNQNEKLITLEEQLRMLKHHK